MFVCKLTHKGRMLLPFLTILLFVTGGVSQNQAQIQRVCHDLVNHYNCKDFEHKTLCGSNGIEYHTECDFAKAHCQHQHLSIVYEGHCPKSTTAAKTSAEATHTAAATHMETAMTTEAPTTMETLAMSTAAPLSTDVTTDMTTALNTHKNVITTTVSPVSTDVQTDMTTALNTHKDDKTTIAVTTQATTEETTLNSFKCQILMSASCPSGGTKLCGNDAITYDNNCEFQKEKCKRPSISVARDGPCDTFTILCRAVLAVDCPFGFDPVCGTDGQTYSSLCEEEKTKCMTDPNLQIAHDGNCTKIT